MSKAYIGVRSTDSVHLKRGEVVLMTKTEPAYSPTQAAQDIASAIAMVSFIVGGSLMLWLAFTH